VKSGKGGSVLATQTSGSVTIVPDEGKYGCINGVKEAYFKNETATLNLGNNTVVFKDLVGAEIKEDGITANATITHSEPGQLIAAVYDMSGRFMGCECVDYQIETDSYDINVKCKLEQEKSYIVKVFLWNSLTELLPSINAYKITVSKK